jgi:hypothetical protein
MRFNDIRAQIEIKAPNLLEKHPARDKPTVAAQQEFEQAGFPRLQFDRLARALHRARDEINFKVARSEPSGRATKGRTPRQRVEARQQLLEGERLDEIIVARTKALDTASTPDRFGRNRTGVETPSARSRATTDSPVEPGQHLVEDDDVDSFVGSDLEAFAAVRGKRRLMTARPKPRGDEPRSLRIVHDDQGLHARFDSGTGASSPDSNLTSGPAIGYAASRRSQFAGRR